MRQYLPNITGWAELWAWPHSLSSVAFFFFFENQAERRKSSFLFPLKISPTLIWYFNQGFKIMQSLRSDVDRSIDRSTDQLTERQIDRQDDYCNPLVHVH